MKTSTRKNQSIRTVPEPDNEEERLSRLGGYCILDTPADAVFDELTELAAAICKTPVATITLIDRDREWYKSRVGISEEEAPRDISFCAHTILGRDLFIIPDTFRDDRFSSNPFVTDDPPLRFYAAVPLITEDGYALGTLCVIDHVPRRLSSDQKKALKTLAHQVMAQMELRRKTAQLQDNLSKCKEADAVMKINRQLKAEIETKKQIEAALEESRSRLVLALESARAGIWDWNLANNEIIWNEEHEELFGYEQGTFNGNYELFEQRIHPEDKAGFNKAIKSAIRNKTGFHHEYRIIWPDKSIHWMEDKGRFEFDDTNQPVRMYGVVRDITGRKQVEKDFLFTKFAVDHAADSIYWLKEDASVFYVNDAACKELGYNQDELLSMKVYDFNPDMTREIWKDRWEKNKSQKSLFIETRHKRKDGRIIPVEISANWIKFENEEFVCAIVHDISDRKRTEKALTIEKYILEIIAAGYDLYKVMNECCNGIEGLIPGAMCSILLLESDGETLRHGSAPSLPESYNKIVDGIKTGPNVGSCGTAAYFNKRVIVSDITTNNLWADYRDLAAKYNLRACWSTPILASTGKVAGTFAIYFQYPCTPSVSDNELIDRMSHLAGIAIDKTYTIEALIKSEEKFRSIVETTSEWIWECDLEGKHTYSNKTINELLGFDEGDYLAKNAFEIMHPDDRDIIRDKFQDCIEKKTGWMGWIVRWRHKNGKYRYLESNALPIFDSYGEVIGFRGSDHDITHLKKAEQEINELRRRNELILESAGEGIYGLDTNGKTTFINPAAAKMLGWEPGKLIGLKQHDLIHYEKADGSDYPETECPIYKAFQDGHTHHVDDEIFLRKDGSRFPVEYTSTPIRNSSGKLEGAVVMFRDITKRKQSENMLRRSEAMLKEAQRVAHLGSWELDHRTNELFWSDETYRIFEIDKNTFDMTYESFLEAVYPEDRELVDRAFTRAIKTHGNYDINHRLLTPDGRIKYINERCKTYYDEYGKPQRSVGTTFDFTKEKQAEMELEAKARQQQFIARLGRLSLARNDLVEIFDTAVTGIAEILDVEFSKILELQPDGKQFVLISGHGWKDGMIGQTVISAGVDTQAGYTLKSNKPVIVDDLRKETRFNGPSSLFEAGIISGVSVIIEGRDNPYGVLGIHTKHHRKFTQYDVDYVQTVSVILAEAIEHEFVGEQILSSRQRLRNLAARLQAIREDERIRVSQEIHDEVGQSLTGLRIDLAAIKNQLRGDSDLSEKIHSALDLADNTLDTIRRISHNLRPPILDDLGLVAAIEWQVEEFRRYSDCECDLKINTGDLEIQKDRDTVIFRILQEALTNIARHANADKVEVKLLNQNRRLILKVTDNGIGINRHAIDDNNSIGLIGMRERAGSLGGNIDIQPGVKAGTVVRLVIPLSNKGSFTS